MKNVYTASAIAMTVGAMLLGGVGLASALEVKTGNDKVGVKLYGHVNRAVMSVDDGNDSTILHVDNSHSESRAGLKAKGAASEGLTIGGTVEVQWQSNPSHEVSMDEESIAAELKERKMEVYFDFKDIGKLYLGKGDMASDDTSEVDLSGTSLAGNSGVADAGEGFSFHDNNGGVALAGTGSVQLSSYILNFFVDY